MKQVQHIVTIAVLLLTQVTFAQGHKIIVRVTGLRSDKGKLYLSLYNSTKGYPKTPSLAYRLSSAPIINNQSTIVLDHIPDGTYAIACYHDENNNGKLDTNFLGIPSEGTGASNNANGTLGPPKFRDAQFMANSDVSQTININY